MAIISSFPGKSKPKLQEKTITESQLWQTDTEIVADSGFDGLGKVKVNRMPCIATVLKSGKDDYDPKSTDGKTLTVKIKKEDLTSRRFNASLDDIMMLRVVCKSEVEDNQIKEQLFSIHYVDSLGGYYGGCLYSRQGNYGQSPSWAYTGTPIGEIKSVTDEGAYYKFIFNCNSTTYSYAVNVTYDWQVIAYSNTGVL